MKQSMPNIEFLRGIPHNLDDDAFFNVSKNNVIICDDLMSVAAHDPKMADLFTEGSHHRNLSVINLTQNLFPPGKNAATQRRNTQYMIIFKSPMSQDQIRTLGTFMYPGRLDEFLHLYSSAVSKPYGYLVIDAKQRTPDEERFKTDIFSSDNNNILENEVIKTDKFGNNTHQVVDDVMHFCHKCQYMDKNEDIFNAHGCNANHQRSVAVNPDFCKSKELLDIPFFCEDCKYIDKEEKSFDEHACNAIKEKETRNASHSLPKTKEVKMSETTYPCAECGVLYSKPDSLFKHIKQCGGDDDSDSEDVWTRMLNEVHEENENEYKQAQEKYKNESDADDRVNSEMREVYKRDLKDLFKRYFIYAHLLENSDMYNQILEDFNDIQVEKKYSKEKAIKYAIRKNDAIFDQILDEHQESEESDMDE